MEHLIFITHFVFYFIGDTVSFLLTLKPEVFIRVFWGFVFLELPRYVFTDFFVFFRSLLTRRVVIEKSNYVPKVSIIVPVLNEGETINLTLRSLLNQSYPNYEIIVVDDGSTDNTVDICQVLASQGKICFLRPRNRQGKSAALNHGLGFATGEFIIFMDSDSCIDRDALWVMTENMKENKVGAVAGNLAVLNSHKNLLTRLQTIEYMTSMTIGRMFRSFVGILCIVPGAFGAFRKSLLKRVGGHEPGPGNDSDLTIRIRKLNYKVDFKPNAICSTMVPETVTTLALQRLRWDRNMVRNKIRKHSDVYALKHANFNLGTLIGFADAIFFGCLLSILWLIYCFDIITNFEPDLEKIILANIILHMIARLVQFLIALFVTEDRKEKASLIIYIPFMSIYRLFLRAVRITGTLQELLFRKSYQDTFAPRKVREQGVVY